MPIRMLRDWTDSEAVNSIPVSAEVLFVRLIMKADDYGRFSANPKLLRALCFPLRDGVKEADIVKDLAACERAGLLFTYNAQGKRFLEIVNFGQRLRNSREKYPPPQTSGQNQQSAATSGDSRQVAATSGDFRPELNGMETEHEYEEKGMENEKKGKEEDCSKGSESLVEQTGFVFRIKSKEAHPEVWTLGKRAYDALVTGFPGLAIDTELLKAVAWCEANGEKRKTARGMNQFLYRWLERANNRLGAVNGHEPPPPPKKSRIPEPGSPELLGWRP